MTLYYQIIEIKSRTSTYYAVRRAWNLFGWFVSPVGVSRWVGDRPTSGCLFSSEMFRGEFNTLSKAQDAAYLNADAIFRDRDIANATSKVVQMVQILEPK